jgi:hypothetical protein
MVYYKEDKENLKELYASNERFEALKGGLSDNEAKLSLIEFMRYNLEFTVEMLFGIRLFPYQVYLLEQMFEQNFMIFVASRGGAKSFLGALFILLYGIFYNETRIIVASSTLRSAKRLLGNAEKLINAKGAELAKECFPIDLRRSTDQWELKFPGGGFIKALPLNDKIRGERADLLVIDEALQLNADHILKLLMPYLTARENIAEIIKTKEQEDALIEAGIMEEKDRTALTSNKKMIALSSASYQFQYFYEWYNDWVKKSMDSNTSLENGKYFVARLSYLSLPKELVEDKIIEEAKSGGESSSYFKMEYMALFPNSSENFFSLEHMIACTIPDGEYPCVQVKGEPDAEYILAIDPSFSSGKDSDFFAMGVFMINHKTKNITLVNSYAVSGGNLTWHIDYLYYLLNSFNIVLITADLLGGQGEARGFNFIQAANESARFKNAGIELKFFDGNLDDCGEEYSEEIKKMRKTYNRESKTICYTQGNRVAWKRRANEYLQHFIQSKKLFFASKVIPNEQEFIKLESFKLPVTIYDDNKKPMTTAEFLEEQDDMIDETKAQISLIELKISSNNNFSYDLPASIKAMKGESRCRRDNYTTTLMACWASKFYFDYMNEDIGKTTTWTPFFIA